MAQPTNAFSTFDAIGIREDLSDVIYNIAPTETPALMMFGRGNCTSTKHEWQVDTLAAAASNRQIDGDDVEGGVGFDAIDPTDRLFTHTQISAKAIVITGSTDAVNKAGRKSELAYQLAKKSKELKRDMEFHLCGNFGTVIGSNTVARSTGSLRAWIHTNTDLGSGGSNATFTLENLNPHATLVTGNDATDGTQRALLESNLKEVVRKAWVEGGTPSVVLCGGFNKQVISSFTGGATRFDQSEDKRLVAAVDVYVSDFGDLRIVPDRFSRDRDVFVLDPSLWRVDYLRGFRQFPLAKTGDSEKRELLVEWALSALNEKGSGVVADCTDS